MNDDVISLSSKTRYNLKKATKSAQVSKSFHTACEQLEGLKLLIMIRKSEVEGVRINLSLQRTNSEKVNFNWRLK